MRLANVLIAPCFLLSTTRIQEPHQQEGPHRPPPIRRRSLGSEREVQNRQSFLDRGAEDRQEGAQASGEEEQEVSTSLGVI